MNQLQITVGEKLFEFDTFNCWVNKAQGWFQSSGYTARDSICVDTKGRICLSGREFGRARDEDAFPVTVYAAINDTPRKTRCPACEGVLLATQADTHIPDCLERHNAREVCNDIS